MAGQKKRDQIIQLYDSLQHETRGRKAAAARMPAAPGKPTAPPGRKVVDIARQLDELERERKRLENRDYAQNTELKRRTLRLLFRFLAVETALVFAFSFAQATQWPLGFRLEEWSFKLLVAATITQITGMLLAAVRYLFPKNST